MWGKIRFCLYEILQSIKSILEAVLSARSAKDFKKFEEA